MTCECEYALCTLTRTFAARSSEHWVKYDLTAHCPSGPFPASRYISTCILFCFSFHGCMLNTSVLYSDKSIYNVKHMLWYSKGRSH